MAAAKKATKAATKTATKRATKTKAGAAKTTKAKTAKAKTATAKTAVTAALVARPLTPERWNDLEAVFNARGCSIARGCWCMFYRRSGSRPAPPAGQTRADANRADLRKLLNGGTQIGLIGYRGRTPVGWISFGPREDFEKLARSPVMKPVDDQPVWSIVCFVVPREYRGQGVASMLLRAAVDYAGKKGAKLVEAYPIDKPDRQNDEWMWHGAKSMYDAAGFTEVARRKPTRPIVRMATR